MELLTKQRNRLKKNVKVAKMPTLIDLPEDEGYRQTKLGLRRIFENALPLPRGSQSKSHNVVEGYKISSIPRSTFKVKHEQTKYEAGKICQTPLRSLKGYADAISEINKPVSDASLRCNMLDSRPDIKSVVNKPVPDPSLRYNKPDSTPGEAPNVTKYTISHTCYPRYMYTKKHAANIKDDFIKIRRSWLINQKPVIQDVTVPDITLYVIEPCATDLFLHPSDLVLRAPERCISHRVNFGKQFSKLYKPNYSDRTMVAVERFGPGKDKLLAAFLPAVNNDDMAGLEKNVSKEIKICLKENVSAKLCDMMERDILLQTEEIYEDLDTDRCDLDNKLKSGNVQQNIPCSCSADRESCKCLERIIEAIKRIQADIVGLVKRSRVPEDEKPQLNTTTEQKVDDKVINALKQTSRSIDYCGYNLDTLYIFVKEKTPSQKLKEDIDKTMAKLRIKSFRVVSSHVQQYSNPASGAGVKVVSKMGTPLCGTLAGFGRLEEKKILVAIMARHLAIYSEDKKLYICHGLGFLTGDIMKQIFEIQKAECTLWHDKQDNSDETTCKPASNNYDNQRQSVVYPKIDVDMALASICEEDEHACDTRYRTDKNEPVPGRLCVFDREQLGRLPVYIWGNSTRPGLGIISITDVVPVNDPEKHLLMIEDKKNNTFCKEGDSGAMVCADDPDNYGEKVLLISMVMGCMSGEEGKYMTVKIKEGLEHIAKEVGENVNIC